MHPIRTAPWSAAASLALLLAATACSSRPRPEIAAQQPRAFQATIRREVTVPYLLFQPQGYERRGPRRWPLLIFLHGAGERGTNLAQVTRHGPPKLVANRPDFPFVVLSPQCPEGQTWDIPALDALLSDILAREAIDPHRVYLTGLSMGGFGTWAWAAAHPERFAAIAPICGGGDPLAVRLAADPRRPQLARLPIWAFHGAQDPVVLPMESERMIEAYRRLGNQPRLTVYPDADHDSWTRTYDDPAFYDWLLQQQLP